MEAEAERGGNDDEGAPAWVMTFADLMSLLMCFFVLLLSFSEMEALKFKQIAGSMREAFGVQKEIKVKEPPKGTRIIAKEFSPGRPVPTPLNQVRQHTTNDKKRNLWVPDANTDRVKADVKRPSDNSFGPQSEPQPNRAAKVTTPQNQTMQSASDQSHELDDRQKAQAIADRRLERETLRDRMRIEAALEEEINKGMIEVAHAGKKVIIRIREKGSFPSGSAELIELFYPVLIKISDVLQATAGQIVVAGHTDNRPIKTKRFRSNWELAASRAVTVAHELLVFSGLPPRRFRVEGYADTQPVDDNKKSMGRARNRRVEVTIVKGKDTEGGTLEVSQETAAETMSASQSTGAATAVAPGT